MFSQQLTLGVDNYAFLKWFLEGFDWLMALRTPFLQRPFKGFPDKSTKLPSKNPL